MANEQAKNLREQKRQENKRTSKAVTRIGSPVKISVTSGKGGVGKSNFALNVAIALASFEQKVLLVDADINLANLDILIGLNPKYNLSDMFNGSKQIEDIIIDGPGGIKILPGSSGVIELMELDETVQKGLLQSFAQVEKEYDFIIIDTGAGINQTTVSFAASADDCIVISTNEPTSFTDAYAMIKVLSHRSPTLRIHVLVNMVRDIDEAADVFDKLSLVAQNFLDVNINTIGYLPYDPNVGAAVSAQMPFVLEFPKCPASSSLRMIARKLLSFMHRTEIKDDSSLLNKLILNQKSKL